MESYYTESDHGACKAEHEALPSSTSIISQNNREAEEFLHQAMCHANELLSFLNAHLIKADCNGRDEEKTSGIGVLIKDSESLVQLSEKLAEKLRDIKTALI